MGVPLVNRLRAEAAQHFGSARADELAALLREAAEALEVLAAELDDPAQPLHRRLLSTVDGDEVVF